MNITPNTKISKPNKFTSSRSHFNTSYNKSLEPNHSSTNNYNLRSSVVLPSISTLVSDVYHQPAQTNSVVSTPESSYQYMNYPSTTQYGVYNPITLPIGISMPPVPVIQLQLANTIPVQQFQQVVNSPPQALPVVRSSSLPSTTSTSTSNSNNMIHQHLSKVYVEQQLMKNTKECPVCGKMCSRPSTLKTHFLIHTGDTPFKCTYHGCKKSFNVKSNMFRHLKCHERKKNKKLQ